MAEKFSDVSYKIFFLKLLEASSFKICADGPVNKGALSVYLSCLLVELELLSGFFDFFILDFRVLLAVIFFLSTMFFRKCFPMAGVDGATFLVDFLIISPWRTSVFLF